MYWNGMDEEKENIRATTMAMRDKDKAQSAVIKLWFEDVFFVYIAYALSHID